MRKDYRPWSSEEIGTAAEIWARDYVASRIDGKYPHGLKSIVLQKIADAVGRSFTSAYSRLHDYGPTFDQRSYDVTPKPVAAPRANEAERQRRLDARARLDLTGRVLGDPPPGYSALDKIRGLNP